MTETAHPVLDEVEHIIKKVLWDSFTTVGVNAFFAWAPWLAIPVVRPAVNFILVSFSDFLFSVFKENVDMAAIPIINKQYKDKFTRASVTLKIIARDKGIDSDDFKYARQLAKDSLDKFIHWNAVA